MRLLILSAIFLISLCGCRQTDDLCGYTKISQEEYAVLENNAREFAVAHEKLLTAVDKKIIIESVPEFSIYYVGNKYAQFGFTWKLNGGRILSVDGMGDLRRKDSIKSINISLLQGISGNTSP